MDDELKAYLDEMMVQINGKFDQILDQLTINRTDIDTTQGHLLYVMQTNLAKLEQRK